MALETKRAAFNTAMDAAYAAWNDLFDGLTAGDSVTIVFPTRITSATGAAPAAPVFPTTPSLQETFTFKVPVSTSELSYRWCIEGLNIGRVPLGWKCTDKDGNIS